MTTRRAAIATLAQCVLIAHPFSRRVLAFDLAGQQIDRQPLAAGVRRLLEAMAYIGEPFSEAERTRLDQAATLTDGTAAVAEIQRVLDARCLLVVRINPESRVSVERGAAPARLVEQGWRAYVIKVQNEAGVTAALGIESPQALPVVRRSTGNPKPALSVSPADVEDRWLVAETFGAKPMEPQLSGLGIEYRIVLLYSRDRGKREAQIGALVGPATQDIGFRNRAAVLFDIVPSTDVTVRVRDERGQPCMAGFVIRDKLGHVFPARSKRLAPDFFFQDQIYRADGETIRLPAGEFTVTCGRGPEYLPEVRPVTITTAAAPLDFKLRRWIDPPSLGWYSGDHHIHAAGCSHYESPTEGVRPEDMMRHVLGEALSVGSVLNWGPSYYYQRQFFEAKEHKLSTASTLLRYDLEISGFPSSHCGHLVLLRVRDQNYPGASQIEDWPTWDLPILKWAKAQGAVTGFAHSGIGLAVKSRELPSYEMPNFDGIGANEYIMDVTHDVVDFISAADTPFLSELNIWYHTLNCGFRTRISGETDFPCITDQRVGAGRSYVELAGALTYDAWCDGVRDGRSYVSDGFSHLMDFAVNKVRVGAGRSEVSLPSAGTVRVAARVACLMPETPGGSDAPGPGPKAFWTPEHARIPGSREVAVEVVVNGRAASKASVVADGALRDVAFDVSVERSSWIALRILGSAHTNPVFVLVGNRPIRASRRSADWCLKAVDQCWSQKSRRMNAADVTAAQAAYEHARRRYRQILAESEID